MPVSKALAGAIVAIIVGLLARYGVILEPELNAAVMVIVTAAIGFLGVYIAPKNKDV